MNILSIIVSSAVGFLASYFAQWPAPPKVLWRRYTSGKKRVRNCYTIPSGKIYIIPSSSSDGVNRYLSEHDMACVETVTKMLREFGYREGDDFQVFFQDPHEDTVPLHIRNENLILVCGPKRNKLVESVLRDFPTILNSVHLDLSQKPAFIWQGKTYTPTNNRDYALMAAKQNPYRKERKLIMLFGLESIGTKGVSSFYASADYQQERIETAERLETRPGEIEVLLLVNHTQDYDTITRVAPVIPD